MLRVTADLFSGRPNPTWIVTNDALTKRVIAALTEDRALAMAPEKGFQGLGFRGVQVEILSDDEEKRAAKMTGPVLLTGGKGPQLKAGGDLASALIKEMTKSSRIVLLEHALTPVNKRMQELVLKELHRFIRKPPQARLGPLPRIRGRRRTIGDPRCDRCQYEISLFNPAFWNSDTNVRHSNNCYNYARNWRTNTFAQPGRASGSQTSVMSCSTVSTAAKSDGLVERCKCLPKSEYPRRLMALVIWPGADYHWYRHQIGGFWGHKPGQTAARNTDNSGIVIANPETCDRGNYTDFCGYFYAGKSVNII